jgi:hypothetical protein
MPRSWRLTTVLEDSVSDQDPTPPRRAIRLERQVRLQGLMRLVDASTAGDFIKALRIGTDIAQLVTMAVLYQVSVTSLSCSSTPSDPC